jgi:hypothetical protein
MRRLNWTPVIVPNVPRAEEGEVHKGEIPSAAHSNSALTEDRLVDIRFTIAVAIALGLPALIGAGVYLAATILLRLS